MDNRGKVITNFNVIYNQLFGDEQKKTNEKFQEILYKQGQLISSERRIFVHGTDLKPRISNVNEANLKKVIHNNLFKNGYRSVFPTQAYSWNEIIDGRSVTIINNRNSGKTMTFLPPLLSLLSSKQDPDEDASQGPIAIIITNTSREVETLYFLCKQLVPTKDIKIVKAFGIWNFKEKCIELLNGCDLLITTPSCFTRFTECDAVKMFDRNRIRHLILENFDLMYKKFKTDLEIIFKLCTKGTDLPHENPQIIITATCWQDFLNFFTKFSSNSIIVIDSYIEAALYAKSRFTVIRKSLMEKDEQILNNLGQFHWRMHRTAIVFSEQDEIDSFKVLLRNRSLSYEVLDGNTTEYNMEMWSRLKQGRMTILLILDSVLTRVEVYCIQILIHYSLPETWSAFCRRFSLSLDYYKFYADLPIKNKENLPRAVINLDENNINEIPRLIHFLSDRRLIQQIPTHIQNEAKRIQNEIEKAKTDADNELVVPLCSNILKFAACSRYKCPLRHAFISDDEPTFIPKTGKIKFKLIGMNSPIHLVAIITDYLAPNSTDWISYYDKIKYIKRGLKELQEYLSDYENQIMDFPQVGNIYGYLNTQTRKWQRCKIIKLDEKTESISQRKASIEFIDDGGRSSVNTSTLMKLPDDIKMLDPLACVVRIVNLVPYDSDEIFDRETIEVVKKHISKVQLNNDYMMCDIELAAGHTIITTNVTVHKKLKNLEMDVLNLSTKKYLLDNKFALYQDILDELKDIAVSTSFYKPEEKIQKIEVVEEPKEVKAVEQKANFKQLQIGRTYKASLTSFESPELFYVQIIDKNICEVQSKLLSIEKHHTKELLKSYKINTICLFKSDDGKMKRCIITKNEPLEVLLVDYATKIKPKLSNIYEISNDLISMLPFQAVKCGIKGLITKGILTLGNILAYKNLFRKISKDGIFELEVHSKQADKFIVSAYNTNDDHMDIKNLALKQNLGVLTDEEIHEQEVKKATEHIQKLLENDKNVNLYQNDANKMLGLPSTARFLPPKEIQELLGESELVPVENALKAIENVPEIIVAEKEAKPAFKEPKIKPGTKRESKITLKESKITTEQKWPFKEPKIITLLRLAEEKSQKVAKIEEASKKAQEVPKPVQKPTIIELKNIYSNVNIEWNQNNGIIMLRIEAVDMVQYSLKVTQTTCEICIKYEDKTALANIELYGRIIPKYVVHKSNGRYITMFLIKKFTSDTLWPRLTFRDDKNSNIKYSAEDLKISFSQNDINVESKAEWAPAGFYSDNEDDYFNEYDDNIENDENQL